VEGTEFARIVNASVNRNLAVSVANGWTLESMKRWLVLNRGVIMVDYQAWIEQPGCSWETRGCNWTQQQWGQDYDDGHYSLLIGFNESGILLMDPSQGDLDGPRLFGFITNEQFLWRWHDTDSWNKKTFRFGLAMSQNGTQLPETTWPSNIDYTF
jgi:hypothetical protein